MAIYINGTAINDLINVPDISVAKTYTIPHIYNSSTGDLYQFTGHVVKNSNIYKKEHAFSAHYRELSHFYVDGSIYTVLKNEYCPTGTLRRVITRGSAYIRLLSNKSGCWITACAGGGGGGGGASWNTAFWGAEDSGGGGGAGGAKGGAFVNASSFNVTAGNGGSGGSAYNNGGAGTSTYIEQGGSRAFTLNGGEGGKGGKDNADTDTARGGSSSSNSSICYLLAKNGGHGGRNHQDGSSSAAVLIEENLIYCPVNFQKLYSSINSSYKWLDLSAEGGSASGDNNRGCPGGGGASVVKGGNGYKNSAEAGSYGSGGAGGSSRAGGGLSGAKGGDGYINIYY